MRLRYEGARDQQPLIVGDRDARGTEDCNTQCQPLGRRPALVLLRPSSVLRCLSVACLSLLGLGLPTLAPAFTLTEDFDDGTLHPGLKVVADPGFSFTIADGKGVFEQAEGAGNGAVYLQTNFLVFGDFIASVDMDRSQLGADRPAELGLHTSHASGFMDIFFVGSLYQMNANFVFPPDEGGVVTYDSSPTPFTFRIRRVGEQVFFESDPGSGFVEIWSVTDPRVTEPAVIGLFLIQEFGNTDAHSGTADNFSIEAAGPGPSWIP